MKAFIDRVFKSKQKKQKELLDDITNTEVIQENKESLLLKWGSSLRDESLETTIQEIWAFERRRENSNIDSVLITQAEEELDSLNIDV